MIMVLGVGLFLAGFGLFWIARSRGNEMVPFLRGSNVEEIYVLLIVGLMGIGLACFFGGLAGIGG